MSWMRMWILVINMKNFSGGVSPQIIRTSIVAILIQIVVR